MHGRLFEFQLGIFGVDYTLPFPSYFVLLLTGFLFATVMGAIWAKRVGQNPDVIVDLGLAMLLAGVAGGRLLHVLVDGYFWDYVHLCTDPSKVAWPVTRQQCLNQYSGYWDMVANVCRPKEADCFAWARFYAGGLTYYGGFAAASAAAYYLLRADRFPFWKAADMAGMVVPIGLGFGRVGCLLAGCCFGTPTHSPLALSFPGGSPASESHARFGLLTSPGEASLPVHPTQIYESGAAFLMAAVLILYLHGRKRYDGQIFLAFVTLYAAVRFVLEFLRDDDRGGLLGLSTSQLVGLLLLVAVYFLHQRLSRPRAVPPAAPPTTPDAIAAAE
ncbi:MAG TPA: prolipoprotein diacylglyceryl transferase family protein [Polyangiaceae bacterium]|nr:prolipoprotein diacylglyceryl transferase family protein [Polyangiaceae bacterium]